MSALLQANHLTRRYGDYYAANDVSLTLNSGDILGLLGPNGAGKTSTMNMLTGNLSPSRGEVLINQVNLVDAPRTAKRFIGYLPEQPPVYRDLTVYEYLRYAAKLRGVRRNMLRGSITTTCERAGLSEVTQRLIGNLSKGFQQRVGIAQAILHEPDIIILDEPTVGLDPVQIREIRELIRDLGTSHGIILSTHILPEVQAVCNRVHIMHRGRIVYDDTDAEERKTSALLVQFNRDVDVTEILSLSSVQNIVQQSVGRYVITHHARSRTANAIATMAIENQWGLQELTPNDTGLEHIFITLTQSAGAEPQRDGSDKHDSDDCMA